MPRDEEAVLRPDGAETEAFLGKCAEEAREVRGQPACRWPGWPVAIVGVLGLVTLSLLVLDFIHRSPRSLGAGSINVGRTLGLEGSEDLDADNQSLNASELFNASALFRDSLLILQGKDVDDEPRTLLRKPEAKPRFKIYDDPYPWHQNEVRSEALEPALHLPAYKGPEGLWCVGINLAGFSSNAASGRWGKYQGPGLMDLQHFHRMGANCFRLAITWERLQSKLGSEELDPVVGVEEAVDYITQDLDSHVIIAPHNSELGLMHSGVNAIRSDFEKLWIAIAKRWGWNGGYTTSKVIFGLYNEPHGGFEDGVERYFDRDALDRDGKMAEYWRQWAQAAIYGIRKSGAKNLILVPGLHRSSCAEWSGIQRWGGALDGEERTGNTRLAALADPAETLAYEVHEHLDMELPSGCLGHQPDPACEGQTGCYGADEGLERTIAWAQTYKKRLMMTEVSSLPGRGRDECKGRLHSYLQRLNSSGVFLGYQAWQYSCSTCTKGFTPKEPRNLEWYRLHDFGRGCSMDTEEDCSLTRCCSNPASKCYQKDMGWAACREECTPGIDKSEGKGYQTPWTCEVLSYAPPVCSNSTADCSKTQCCTDPGLKCYQKEPGWAACRRDCSPGKIWTQDAPEHQTPWDCELLGVTQLTYK